jgi:TonB family protein
MKKKHLWLRRLPMLIGLVLSLAVGVTVYLLRDLFQKAPTNKRVVQQISVVQPPPPPPPPPVQKPPEPEIKEEKLPEPEPEPEKEPEPALEESQEPASDQLGVDAAGGAGSDAFGLQARKGGRPLLAGGGGGLGAGGSMIHWYGGQVRQQVADELDRLLSAESHARRNAYAAIVDIWVGPDGRLSRAELSGSSGKPEVDQAIREALPRLSLNMPKPPPANMPQPVRIRVTSRL